MLFSVAVGFHAVSHSHFRIDDYAHFSQSEQLSLLDFAKTPIDVHFAPLHRLTTASLHAHFRTNFAVAVALLIALQIGALLLVDRLLERLGPSRWNGLLLAIFAANVYLIVPVSYWTSGLHRIPFTVLSAMCILAYLRFRDEGKRRDQVVALTACLLSMGFYSKAALLPPMLVAFELCLLRRPAVASLAQRGATLVGLAALLLLYPLWYAFHPLGFAPLLPAFNDLPAILAHSFSVFAQAPFGFVATPESSFPIGVAIAWGSLAAITVYRDRFNAVIWFAFVSIIAVHITMIGLSQRAHDLGALVAYLYRYEFELALPLVVFGKLLLGNPAAAQRATRLPDALRSRWWVPAAVAVYALFSWIQANELMRDHYGANQRAHDYTTNILEQLPSNRPLMLIDGRVPRYMWVYDRNLRFHSNFLPLLGIEASYDIPSDDLFRIASDGTLGRVRPVQGQSFEFSELGSERNRSVRRLSGLTMDERGCIDSHDAAGGVLELHLPARARLDRGFVSVEYETAASMKLHVATWDGNGPRPAIGGGHELVLPAGDGERLIDVSSSDLEPVSIQALGLSVPASGLCLRAVRLVGYELDGV